MPQPLRDELDTLAIVTPVHDAHVVGIGAQVNTGRPRVDLRLSGRTSCPVSGGAIGRLKPDLSRPLQLWGIRVHGPFTLPIIEDARGVLLLFRRFTPIPR